MVSSSTPTRISTLMRGGEVGRQLEAVAHEGVEAGQRERHAIGARPQVDDRELALLVGDDRSHLLDEDRTRRFDGDARQDRARRIPDGSGNRALRRGDAGEDDKRDDAKDSSLRAEAVHWTSTARNARATTSDEPRRSDEGPAARNGGCAEQRPQLPVASREPRAGSRELKAESRELLYQRVTTLNPIIRGCMMLFGRRYDEPAFSALVDA